jgi:hypothetical protein
VSGYDQWLEAPYVDAARREAAYEQWCESQGFDPAEDHWQAFEDATAQPDPDEDRL